MSVYPSALDSFTTKVDNVTTVYAADVNNLQNGVIAVQTVVGISGSFAFVQRAGDLMSGNLNFASGTGIGSDSVVVISGATISTIGSIIPSQSGTNDLGSADFPFKTVYADDLVDTSGSSMFVKRTGDTMTGPLYNDLISNAGAAYITIYGSVAEGIASIASGVASHAEGDSTLALGDYSHAEGGITKTYGENSHAEGDNTIASGISSHAEGSYSYAIADYSHAEGSSTFTYGDSSHAEGGVTKTYGEFSHAEGFQTSAFEHSSHAEGYGTIASGLASHAEGNSTQAIGGNSHAEGDSTLAFGDTSHAEGYYTIASGNYSHAEGNETQALGFYSHAEGDGATAHNNTSHAEGDFTHAYGYASHTEGNGTIASGNYSHAEGNFTQAIGENSHAEGLNTKAIGENSHAEGQNTEAWGLYGAHAQGIGSIASGNNSFAAGWVAKALHNYSTVFSDNDGAESTSDRQFTISFQSGISLTSGTSILNTMSGVNSLGSANSTFGFAYIDNIISATTINQAIDIATISGSLVTSNSNLATVSGVAATAIQTISSSGLGVSLYNTKLGTTAFLNSISGLGTVTATSTNGVINLSGSTYADPLTAIASSGLGLSLVDGLVGTTQYLNSISGVGTVSLTGPTNGIITVSGSMTPTFTTVSSNSFVLNTGIPNGVPLNQQGPKLFYQMTPLAATTVTTIGGPAATINITLSEPAWGAAYGWGQLATTGAVASGSPGSNAGINGSVLMFGYLSGDSTIGNMGWTHRQRFHQVNGVSGVNACRIVAGMASSTNAPTLVYFDSPAATSYAMLQSCTASGAARQDRSWKIAYANAGTQSLTDTALPQTSGSVYDLYLSMPNVPTGGSKTLNWQLKNLTSDTQASGTITSDNLPPPSTAMCPHFQITTCSSGTATAAAIRYSYNYTESIL
jgi:hypothetical protein